jgi:eukaryotic-like serine/threonine-protein kinase
VNAPVSHERERTPDAAYGDTEQGRALLQTRIERLSRILAGITLAFLPIGLIARGVWGVTGAPGLLTGAFNRTTWLQVASVVVFTSTWLYARAGERSELQLRFADLWMTVVGSLTFLLMGLGLPAWTRPDVFTLFLVAQLLAIRATFIPCTERGSIWIAAGALLPAPFLAYYFFSQRPIADGPSALGLAITSFLNVMLVLVVTGLISSTVHGLRQRVKEAMKLGQYTLDHKIGEGGMGVVYKASHALLRRPTAIKLLPPERAGEHNLVRFEREVQLTSMLTHPNTVSIYDFGRTPEGTFYYAMEYLEGFDLETLVRADGPQAPGRVVHLLAQMCGALAEAHAVGLIHRDVKPANVILCERGGTPDVVKVLDFGLVKQIGPDHEVGTSHSTINHIVGTPLYLSPEGIITPQKLDGRSDLYALGCVGYMLLTGAPPFTGESVVEVCGHHLHTPPPPLSGQAPNVPADLARVIMQCLSKSRDDRPANATILRRELLACDAAADWSAEGAHLWWSTRGKAIMTDSVRAPRSIGTGSPSVVLTRAVS